MTSTSSTLRTLHVVLVGNPNTGKTTLFNALTGLRHRVGNYPGVTVETKSGRRLVPAAEHHGPTNLSITDVPGVYSLSPRSPDEMLTVELLLGHRWEHPRPHVVVCVVDASNLERNMYLATQVMELGIPVVLALNMVDVASSRGIDIDVDTLALRLGMPVVAVQANIHRGISELCEAVVRAAEEGQKPAGRPVMPPPFLAEVRKLGHWFTESSAAKEPVEDYLLERAILDVGGYTERFLVSRHGPALAEFLAAARNRLREQGCPVPATEARSRYGWISERLSAAVRKPTVRLVTLSDRIDRVLMHRFWGMIVFLGLMALVFSSIYSWAQPLMDGCEALIGLAGDAVGEWVPEGPFRDLLLDGVIAGVGGVLVFLPQIIILFGFIAVLEDCGYMARAAFLMDKLMSRCGLSGKSFIPLMSSFACAIPGVMATRTIEDRRDRLTTILVAPLMSCSARLPVYLLLIGAFVPSTRLLGIFNLQAAVLLGMYLLGLTVAPLVAWLLKRSFLRGEAPVFLMELPSYKFPSITTVLHRMYDRGKAFVLRAGTLILAASICIWALQYYPRPASIHETFEAPLRQAEERYIDRQARVEHLQAQLPLANDDAAAQALRVQLTPLLDEVELAQRHLRELENQRAAAYQEQSVLGRMGKAIEPVVEPLGWDWRIGMAALASFPAREVVVAAMGTIFSAGAVDDPEDDDLRAALQGATWPDGAPLFTLPTALSLMVFFALCCQCAATLVIIRRETNSWRWPAFTFFYMTGLAYVAALIVYQVGSRL